ncbi:MAG TPA: ABC transporter ATP-binding protein [Anaerolineae bacterium]|nr:ABC transporter ATP-binding protein [Anaerolineae bacterium]
MEKLSYRVLLRDYFWPQGWRLVWLGVLLAVNIGLQLWAPQIMRDFLDVALAEEGGSLTGMALLFLVVAFSQQLAAVGATYVGENVGWIATNQLRYDLARHCLYLDNRFHHTHTPGEMIERIDGDINTLSTFFARFVLQLVGNGILLVGIVLLLWWESVEMGGAITVFVIVAFLILVRFRNVAVPHWQASREASSDYYSFVEEQLAGTEDVRANGAIPFVMYRFFELLRHFWQTTVRARLFAFGMTNLSWLMFAVGAYLSLGFGAQLYVDGVVTLGSVYLIFHYTTMLHQPMQRIVQEIETLQQAGAGVARIRELSVYENQLVAVAEPVAMPVTGLGIALEDVWFAYERAEGGEDWHWILRGVGCEVAEGKVLGLLGRTGSGKTTITRLLLRLYDLQKGSVKIGGIDVRQFDLRQLRQTVGIVTQTVELFHASVRDNLTFFDAEIDDEAVVAAVEMVGMDEWLAGLPAGLDTVLVGSGGDLSAGQAQLLAMARIFLKNPQIIILDEASSRLDPATEQRLERALDKLLVGRTVIIIAHRLATVARADEILILEGGKVVEQGEREALLANPDSRLSALWRVGLERWEMMEGDDG